MEIHILYVTDNVSEVNHFPIYRIRVGWVYYTLVYPIIESFIDSIKYFGVDLGVYDSPCPLYNCCCIAQISEEKALV